LCVCFFCFFFFQAEDGIRDFHVTGVQTCALPIYDENFGSTFDVVDIPADMLDEVKEYRALLIEQVAEYDENLLEKFFEDENSIRSEERRVGKECRYRWEPNK